MHVFATLTSDPNSPGSSGGTVTPAAGTALSNDVGIQYRANATGAASVSKVTAAATTNATSVKASAGRLVGFTMCNTTAAFKFLRLYNLAVAPTVGTSVPYYVIGIPPNSTVISNRDGGVAFATGIAYAITGLVGDLDATATAANDVIGSLFYA